jgi:hypothetical protein
MADKTAEAPAAKGSVDGPADKSLNASENDPANPYPNYDLMSLEDLQSLADERGVEVNRDVLKAHLVTELRAADSGAVSPAVRKGAR